MSDLQSLISRLSAGPVSTYSYVYYEKETGKISKVSSRNVFEEDLEIFEIETDEVNSILTGERRTDEFVVLYDVSLKQLRLKEVAYDDSHNTASTMCYQLPIIKRLGKVISVGSVIKQVILEPQYDGIHIDVWYDELLHLAGQHVWIDNNVYRLVQDQPANTKFNIKNVELVIADVKLYSDKNKELKLNRSIKIGDLILKNNNVFIYDSIDSTLHLDNDIVIQQDTNNNVWNISINPHTKKFLRMSGYNPKETLYFSVTKKYDPNILYRSLEFTVGDLLSESLSIIPFICDSEQDPNNVSIYTAKYFDKYAHEVI